MTAERAWHYGQVMRTLEDVGAAKLHPAELARVRSAADTLVLAGPRSAEATAALLDVVALINHLRDAERWTEDAAEGLLADVAACGPTTVGSGRRAAVYA